MNIFTAGALVAAVVAAVWLVHARSGRGTTEDQQLAELAEADDAPMLLKEMIGLRKDLGQERGKHLRDRIVFGAVVLALLLLWNGQRTATDDIIAARTQGRASTCALFQAYTDALVQSGQPPATQEKHDEFQARVDAFVAFLNSKAGPINCVLHAPQVAPAPTPGAVP